VNILRVVVVGSKGDEKGFLVSILEFIDQI